MISSRISQWYAAFTAAQKFAVPTLEAKARLEKVSAAWMATGATLQNMSAFESPPSESCSSIVSFEFLHRGGGLRHGNGVMMRTPCWHPAQARFRHTSMVALKRS